MKQGSKEWLEFRKSHIGSSEIAAILGISPWLSPYKLWLIKTNDFEIDDNPAMEYGRRMEPEVLNKYFEETDVPMLPTGEPLVYKNWEVASASLDGISFDKKKICEIKCPKIKVIEMAKRGEIPEYYKAQIQWQLMVSEANSCDYVVYDHKNDCIIIITVEPDVEYQKYMLKEAKAFWELVVNKREPEKTMKDHVRLENGVFDELEEEYSDVDCEIKALTERKQELKEQLLKLADGKPVVGKRLKISYTTGRKSIDMVSLKEAFMISEEMMKPFEREGKGFWTITLSDTPS